MINKSLLLRFAGFGVLLLLIVAFVKSCDGPAVDTSGGGVLPPTDKEQIIIDPVKRHLIITQENKQTVLTLPDHPSVIDIKRDGSVNVTSPQMGFEHSLFLAGVVSDKFRVGAGVDLYYFKKLDVGLGLAGEIGNHTPIVFVKAAYSVYGNLQLGVVYGTNKYVGGILALRLF